MTTDHLQSANPSRSPRGTGLEVITCGAESADRERAGAGLSGTRAGLHRRQCALVSRTRRHHPHDCQVEPGGERPESLTRASSGSVITDLPQKLRRKGLDQIGFARTAVASLLKVAEDLIEAHAGEMPAIAELLIGARARKGIAKDCPGQGPAGGFDILIHADPDILSDPHCRWIASGPARPLCHDLATPCDLAWRAPVQEHPIRRFARQVQHPGPECAEIDRYRRGLKSQPCAVKRHRGTNVINSFPG